MPVGCKPECVFSCTQATGPDGAADLCSAGTFDTVDGSFSFSTNDKTTYPPGEYTFTVTGSVGSASDSVTITVTIEDPCIDTLITLTEDFADLSYTLRDAADGIDW